MEPPRYERRLRSKLDPFRDAVVAMLRAEGAGDGNLPAAEPYRADGDITILKDWLRTVHPQFAAVAGFQRTSCRHGELCQVD